MSGDGLISPAVDHAEHKPGLGESIVLAALADGRSVHQISLAVFGDHLGSVRPDARSRHLEL